MDATTFLREQARLCRSYDGCMECLLRDAGCSTVSDEIFIDKKVAIVEKWAKEHPTKTRMSEFLKHYPNAPIKESDGLPMLCGCNLESGYFERKCRGTTCEECRKEYWLEEIE